MQSARTAIIMRGIIDNGKFGNVTINIRNPANVVNCTNRVLQKAPNLLIYEIIKTEKFIRKNIADYSCYHHRHFVLMKLFDLQYFDLHDSEVKELYDFVNIDKADDGKTNDINGILLYLLPSLQIDAMNTNKMKSFLYSLNLALHDLKMIQDLKQLHGQYRAFNCYKRAIVKFAIDILQLASNTDYLMFELFSKTPSDSKAFDGLKSSEIVNRLMSHLETDEKAEYAKIFF